ncbi:MAG: hypothetical protein LBB82_00785 [Treponema sp.]|nr:hypothetical protein [Treponema sp.]
MGAAQVPYPDTEGLSFEKVWAALMENREQMQETDRRMQETDRMIKQTHLELEKSQNETRKIVGDLGRKFGLVVEHMFIPNLHKKFKKFGYAFEKSGPNVLIEDDTNRIYAQIDAFLENGDCAMAVEVKAQPNNSDIEEHLERMEKLRRWFDKRGDKRKLYGAVAGAIFPVNVREYTLKQGFYVIEQAGDMVDIISPPGFNPRIW